MPNSKTRFWILVAGILLLLVLLFLWQWPTRKESADDTQTGETAPPPSPTQEQIQSVPTPSKPLFGENILLGYGHGDPSGDLRKVQMLISNYRMLAKGMDARHFSANASLAAALRGEQRIALAALPKDHFIFNEEGLIIDRWDTPLFFHLEAADRLGIYSAGPDGKMGTEDDYSLVGGVVQQGKAEF